MAHLRNIEKKCSQCPSRATVALFSDRNDHINDYCKRCGAQALRERKQDEREANAIRSAAYSRAAGVEEGR